MIFNWNTWRRTDRGLLQEREIKQQGLDAGHACALFGWAPLGQSDPNSAALFLFSARNCWTVLEETWWESSLTDGQSDTAIQMPIYESLLRCYACFPAVVAVNNEKTCHFCAVTDKSLATHIPSVKLRFQPSHYSTKQSSNWTGVYRYTKFNKTHDMITHDMLT